MSYSKKIYKKDSKGKIRELHVYSNGAQLIQVSGLIDGNKITHYSICEPKNVGRSNETTCEEQANFEAMAKIQSKMSEGYFDSINDAKNNVVILPMLAKDYKKESHKVVYPCYVQPKLDGQRALGSKFNQMISRKGKVIDTMTHIQKDLNTLALNKGVFIDGELYSHGLSFQENMKLIKKYRKDETEKIKFHVYDMIIDKPFSKRYEILTALVAPFDNVELVPTVIIKNEEDLKKVHQMYISQGYEGTIIRHSDAPYGVNKRDSQLLKYKDFIDLACKVIDIVPSDKRPSQGVCVCEIKTKNGVKTFHTGMKFSHTERENILSNKDLYVNQIAEVRFFEYTDDGLPRFPVCVGFRNDK